MEQKVRSSNFELLRILSMCMIIGAHYVYYGGLLSEGTVLNQVLASFLRIGGKLGVTIFVLIGAYFLSAEEFKLERIIKLFFETAFYSVLIYLIGTLWGVQGNWLTYIHVVFSPIYNGYWFVTAYMGMLLFSPILNLFLRECKQGKLGSYLIVLFLILSCVSFVFIDSKLFYSDVLWFCFLYLIAGYIRISGVKVRHHTLVLIFILSVMVMWLSSLLLSWLNTQVNSEFVNNHVFMAMDISSPFMLAAGVSLFLVFKDVDIGCRKWINKIAGSTFACYLIHDNEYVRTLFWEKLMRTPMFYSKSIFLAITHIVICIIVIFCMAFLLEAIRMPIEKLLMKNRHIRKVCEKVNDKLTAKEEYI